MQTCRKCNVKMEYMQSFRAMNDEGKMVLVFVYECPKCGERKRVTQ